MASDNFIKFDGIEGESTDDKHKGWIEMLDISWGVSQLASATQSSSGGGSTQRADFLDFAFAKLVDKASPLLAKACFSGQHIDTVQVEFCRSGGNDKVAYLTVKFTNVIVSSINIHGGTSGEPSESIGLNYGKIEMSYTKQDRKGGGTAGNVVAGWNLETNKAV